MTRTQTPGFSPLALALAALACALLPACAGPSPSPSATGLAEPTTLPADPGGASAATVAPLSAPGAAPAATAPPPAEAPAAAPVTFKADPSLAASEDVQTMPAVPAGPGPGFGGAAPAHWLITFAGQSQPDMLSPYIPQMRILPADGLAAIDPSIARTIGELKALLAGRPAQVTGTLPLLPALAAAQVMHAQAKYLDFAAGSGVRFVAHYAQDVSPVTSDRLFYTFQGITADGRYYITLFYPVRTDALPARFEDAPGVKDMDAFVKGFDQYLAETVARLDSLAPDAFSPDLAWLDGLAQSLSIAGESAAPPPAPAPAPAETPTAAATLRAVTTAYVNLRAGPGTQYRIVGNVSRARSVEMLGRDEAASWIRVRTAAGEGWIAAPYLKSGTPFTALPVAQP